MAVATCAVSSRCCCRLSTLLFTITDDCCADVASEILLFLISVIAWEKVLSVLFNPLAILPNSSVPKTPDCAVKSLFSVTFSIATEISVNCLIKFTKIRYIKMAVKIKVKMIITKSMITFLFASLSSLSMSVINSSATRFSISFSKLIRVVALLNHTPASISNGPF